MRLLPINVEANYAPLVNDLIKTATILLVIELVQFVLKMGGKNARLFDNVFVKTVAFQVVGLVLYYLVVDKYITGANVAPRPAETAEKKQ